MHHFLLSIFILITIAKASPASDSLQQDTGLVHSAPVETLQAAASSDSTSDSLNRWHLRDSLLSLERTRRAAFQPQSSDTSTVFFRAVPATWYDIPATKSLYCSPRTVLSGSTNRLMAYGNSLPITGYFPGTSLLSRGDDELYQTTAQLFPNEFSSITTAPCGSLHFNLLKHGIVAPETEIFWENGVFDEKVLSFRFTRPVTKNSIVSIFSNYRFFKGTRFTHDPNDVYTFFSSVTPDTSFLSHKGYNPLVNEFHSGIHLVTSGKTPSFFTLKYGDISNQLPLDIPSANEIPVHTGFRQFPLNCIAGLTSPLSDAGYLSVEGWFSTNRLRWNRSGPLGGTTSASAYSISTQELAGAVRTGISTKASDSIDVTIRSQYRNQQVPDSIERVTSTVKPELRWTKKFVVHPEIAASATAKAGYDLTYLRPDSLKHHPLWHIDAAVSYKTIDISAFGAYDHSTLFPTADSLEKGGFYSFSSMRFGVECSRSWQQLKLSLGYQLIPDPDQTVLAQTWLNGKAPYQQAESSYRISLETVRLGGFKLQSRMFIADTRPYLRANGSVSYLILPKLTHQAIDIRLDGEYWSKRTDPESIDTNDYKIIFAGKDHWGNEIIDINLTTTVHIKSFILFYKIDNLLNRNNSFVPGWTSPGITFRWGFTWFIQR